MKTDIIYLNSCDCSYSYHWPKGFPEGFIWFGTCPGWLCVSGVTVWITHPFPPRQLFWSDALSFWQSLFEKHPNYLLVLWLWKVSLFQRRHLTQTFRQDCFSHRGSQHSASHHGSWRLIGWLWSCHRQESGGAAWPCILTNSTKSLILVVSVTALFHGEKREIEIPSWKRNMGTQDCVQLVKEEMRRARRQRRKLNSKVQDGRTSDCSVHHSIVESDLGPH